MKKRDLKQLGVMIRRLREERNLSQEILAEFLKIPRPSLSQLENGQRDLSFLEFKKLLNVFHLSFDEFINSFSKPKKTVISKTIKITLNKEKFKQLLLYILGKCGNKPNVGETVLYKLLYFCDFDFFELYEKVLTGMHYKKLQYGPVPVQSIYNPIIKEMIRSNEITIISRPYAGDTIQTKYIPLTSYDINSFSPQEIELINKVINRLSDMSARQIEHHVHRDFPWLSHANGEIINYNSVFGRDGEFAQRDYDELWHDASSTDILDTLGPISDEEYNYYTKLK